MSRALTRSVSAIATAAVFLAGSVIPAAASTAQNQTITIPAPDQVSQVIQMNDDSAAAVTGLDSALAAAEADGGWNTDMGGAGLLVFGPALAVIMYEYSVTGR